MTKPQNPNDPNSLSLASGGEKKADFSNVQGHGIVDNLRSWLRNAGSASICRDLKSERAAGRRSAEFFERLSTIPDVPPCRRTD